jgi:hypothetical protein
MRIERRLLLAMVPVAVAGAGLLAAPIATAECISSAGTTLCSQGSTRGGNTGEGPGSLNTPYVPYPCAYDWYCDDRGVGITFGVW